MVGVRLLHLAARTRGPERWLGGYFLASPLLAPACWAGFAVRMVALLWMVAEAFRYHGLLRRRAIGLADPLVANRFLLWGLWARRCSS